MLWFIILFLAVTIFANPIPQTENDLRVDISPFSSIEGKPDADTAGFIFSTEATGDDHNRCTADTPVDRLTDDANTLSSSKSKLFRRLMRACPANGLQSGQEQIVPNPVAIYDLLPLTPKRRHQIEVSKDICKSPDRPVHVSGGGPEYPGGTGIQELVQNCKLGKWPSLSSSFSKS